MLSILTAVRSNRSDRFVGDGRVTEVTPNEAPGNGRNLFSSFPALHRLRDTGKRHLKVQNHGTATKSFLSWAVLQGGMYLVQLLDWYSASISVILVCIVEVIAVGWIYGCEQFVRDVEFMIDRKVERFWIVSWKYITPIVLTVGVRWNNSTGCVCIKQRFL